MWIMTNTIIAGINSRKVASPDSATAAAFVVALAKNISAEGQEKEKGETLWVLYNIISPQK